MHELMLKEVVACCRQRQSDGDYPTRPAFSVEQLEDAVVQLATSVDDTLALLARGVQLMDGEETLRARAAMTEGLWRALVAEVDVLAERMQAAGIDTSKIDAAIAALEEHGRIEHGTGAAFCDAHFPVEPILRQRQGGADGREVAFAAQAGLTAKLIRERDELKRQLAESRQQQEGGWVPVSERLPAYEAEVLLHYRLAPGDGRNGRIVGKCGARYHGGCYWYSPAFPILDEHVTHWMPLPPSPAEER